MNATTEIETGEFPVIPELQRDSLLDCVHCGICLSACPTYDLTGKEGESPRGRIYLIRALAEGRAEINEATVGHFDSCLGCLACETACPSAVPYGELLNETRHQIEKRYKRPTADLRARKMLLDLVTQPAKMAPLMFGAKLAGSVFGEGGGPVGMVNRFLFGPQAPPPAPPKDAALRVRSLPEFTPAKGERRARVTLLAGCVMQVLFQRVNHATIRVLAQNGCDVTVVPAARCCGAFHAHNGFLDEARTKARALIQAYEREEYDALVINSAGCGSAIKEYEELFHDEPEWRERARPFVAKALDASEYLAGLGLRSPVGEFRKRVTYHDACHLAHAQKIRSEPRLLLQTVPGLEFVEFSHSDWCCGSAGIYNFLQPELAGELQEKKVANILDAQPEVLVTGNPGCHSWIEAGLRKRGSRIEVLHTMELLDRAYRGGT